MNKLDFYFYIHSKMVYASYVERLPPNIVGFKVTFFLYSILNFELSGFGASWKKTKITP